MPYKRFNNSTKEVKKMIDGKIPENSRKELIGEFKDNFNSSV